MRARRYCTMLVVAGLLFSASALSQTSNQGAIVGTITDPSGAVSPGAEITLQNVATGTARQTVSNNVGDYRVDFLIPGIYRVTARLAGFKTRVVDDVVVAVGEVRRVDLQLQVGEPTESVVVSASAASLNTENSSLGEVIDSAQIHDLPLNGREFLALAQLTPGAESGSIRRGTVYSRGYAIGVNGARTSYNNYQMDGAEITTTNNELGSSPALEAIKEFRIQTNMYGAQYGRAGGAIISVVTNAGANNVHGSLYEYHRNKVLDALPWGYRGSRSGLAQYLFNQFGASAGGPVVKNKTFFFATTEFYRQKKPGRLNIGFSPNDAERAGDLSHTINPYSRTPVVLNDPNTNTTIPDGKVPSSLISAIGRKITDDLYPKPNYDGDPFLNLRMFLGGVFNQNKYLARVDHNISRKDVIFGTFDFNDYDNIDRGWTPYSDTQSFQHARTASATHTHTFAPNLVNDLKFSYLSYNNFSGPTLADKNYGKEFGISDKLSKANGFPGILLYGPGFMNIGGNGASQIQNHVYYLKNNFGWIKGKHTLLFGGDWRKQAHNYKSIAGYARYYFGLTEGIQAQALKDIYLISGSTYASLLMAIPNLIDGGLGEDKLIPLTRNAFSGYVQDDWKIGRRLTLNLGIRYDHEGPFHVTNGQFMTLDFNSGLPVYSKGASADLLAKLQFKYLTDGPDYGFRPNKHDIAPRFGFAFRPSNDSGFVVRGGYGIVYNSEPASNTIAGSYVVPFAGFTGYIYPRYAAVWPDKQTHVRTLAEEPYGVDYVSTASPGIFTPNSPYYPTGYLQHWNLTVGKQFGAKTAVELGYVASRGVNLNSSTTLALYDPQLLQRLGDQNPAWKGNKGMAAKGFSSMYNSLQVTVRKEYSHGLNLLGLYTWSKAMADGSEDTDNENTLSTTILSAGQPVPFVARRWAPANFDVRQRFSVSGGYELPVGRAKQFGSNWHPVLDGFLGGWKFNWIWTLQGGYPWGVTLSNISSTKPNRVCNGNLPSSERSPDRWFDINCFPTRPPLQYTDPQTGNTVSVTGLSGNAGPNVIIGPGINSWDVGIHKYFPIGSAKRAEARRVELRGEMFNTFNHPQLLGPVAQWFGNYSDGAKIGRAGNQRQIQLALRFSF